MRNTDPDENTSPTMRLSSWALARSWPNGFSITTRRHAWGRSSARPEVFRCSRTTGNSPGGIDR